MYRHLAFLPVAPLGPRTVPFSTATSSTNSTSFLPPVPRPLSPSLPARHRRSTPRASLASSTPRPITIRSLTGRPLARLPPRLALHLVPPIASTFGISCRLLHLSPSPLTPAAFSFLRLLVATLFFYPALRTALRAAAGTKTLPTMLRVGSELGLAVFLANLLWLAGFAYTPASRAAFLAQTQVVLVPLVAAVAGIENLRPRAILAAAVALAGVAVLTLCGGGATGGGAAAAAAAAALATPGKWVGDALHLAGAAVYSWYLVRVTHHAGRAASNGGAVAFMAVKTVVQTALSGLWWVLPALYRAATAAPGAVGGAGALVAPVVKAAGGAGMAWTSGSMFAAVALVLWCGLCVGGASAWLQASGQREVPASEATVIYCATPLWAAAFANVMLGERLGPEALAGGALIVAGSFVGSGGKKDGKEGVKGEVVA